MHVFLLINFHFIVLSSRYLKLFNTYYPNKNVSTYWGLSLATWSTWPRGTLGSWGPGEGESISRVNRCVIHHEVMFRVDSLGLAALTQVIIWALSTLVPSSDHFTLASIADDSRMLLHGSISRWFVTT